jgi:hypothetical protein
MFQQINGMMVPTKMLMRPALAMGRRSVRTSAFLPSRQHVDLEKSLYSYGEPQMYPRYFAGQTSFRLFTASDSIVSEDVSSNKGIDDDDQIVDDEESVDSMNFSDDEEDETNPINFPRGSSEGLYIVKTYHTNDTDFDLDLIRSLVIDGDVERLDLTPRNISVPVALMMLDPDEFPSRSRARKACRKANVMIHRGPLAVDEKTGKKVFDSTKCLRARVGDRFFPGGTVLLG